MYMEKIKFTILTPDGRIYEDEVVKVTVPTVTGEITIYPKHVQLFSMLKPGVLVAYEEGKEPHYMAISGGMITVHPGGRAVQILADTAERGEHIDLARAQTAKKRAEELLEQYKNIEDVDFARVQAQIEKELARIRVGNRYRK